MRTKEEIDIDICEQCWGIWLDGDEMEFAFDKMGLPDADEVYPIDWKCIRCGSEMKELIFYTSQKDLTIKQCPECMGIWFNSKKDMLRLKAQAAKEVMGILGEDIESEALDKRDFQREKIDTKKTQSIEKKGWLSLGIGAVMALVLFAFPLLSYAFSYFLVLSHEFGHAIFGWLYGYPSVPAFDFTYGGGITMYRNRQTPIIILIYLIFALLIYLYRKNKASLIFLFALIALYSFTAFTDWHDIINLFMGHGTELVFAGIFLYRAISRHAIIHSLERPLYAFLGFFMIFYDLRFGFRLINSTYHRIMYEDAKGGGHWMDFSQIATYLDTDLLNVAGFFLICCFLPIVFAVLIYRYQYYINAFFVNILQREPEK
jgi:Zn-finger nucleic acid-binding protein